MSEQPRMTAGTTNAQQKVAAANESQAPRSKGSAGNVLTPIDIMNKRQAREAAKEAARRAEAGEIEEPRRSYEENQRRSMERQRTQAALSGHRDPVRAGGEVSAPRGYESSPPISGDIGKGSLDVPRLTQPRAAPQPPQQQQQARNAAASKQAHPVKDSITAPVGVDQSQAARSGGASFPHAFERWEELSGKWEGLTSYWIHRLETNRRDVHGEPSWAQAQREITDLAAAGANLFHAVVELQRLRASSERKFQRWFWETREQQEHHKERIGHLQRALAEEQNARLNAPQVNVELIEARLQEMRREQQISSDEARRAWEELGRREQADRDVQAALRHGRTVMIGGIQVVPTQATSDQSGHSHHGQQYAAYPHMVQSQHASPVQQTVAQSYGVYEQQDRPSPTDTDPFSGQPATQSTSRPHTSYAYQNFPSGPSPPPMGSMRAMPILPQQSYPGMSPSRVQQQYPQQQYAPQQQYLQSPQQYPQGSQQYYTPQQYPSAAQQYPFPTPGGMPASTMPFYHQPSQYLHQPPAQAMVASPSGPRYQPYVESEGTSEVGDDQDEDDYEVDPSGLDPPPPPGPATHSHHIPSHHSQQSGGEHHQAGPGSPEQSYTTTEPIVPAIGSTYSHYGSEPDATQISQSQPRAISSEDPLYDEPVDYEGQGYGSEAAEWEGLAAHQHHATRLSDVLEAEEESLRSPHSTRSSRIPGQ